LRGPEGTGFLHIAPWILPALTPIHGGYRALANPTELEASKIVLSSEARQFEVGTISHLNFSALGIALRLYLEEGYIKRVEQVQSNAAALIDLLQRESAISLATPVEAGSRAGIVSFRDARFESDKVLHMLRQNGIIAGARKGLVRVSAGPEVDTDELIQRTRAALAIR
jgi:Selenocysteine lyase